MPGAKAGRIPGLQGIGAQARVCVDGRCPEGDCRSCRIVQMPCWAGRNGCPRLTCLASEWPVRVDFLSQCGDRVDDVVEI
jgi:hypothetical protein